ncbi:DUF4333 domain-containing protein [Mycobacterium shimoidei]|uniref:DUF4333 domain-containing protein n=1 Tax=Mycobacterium shimoidei TaxID=29313 RepID=A0A1E3TGM0_MYCSH|nr:DUF4333 domain-containing protein [Mycobacterium shimoidei]MCV7261280.1 DUF4333 domain-containing protein [Mycobacterium shimoidei]ODR13134.1 hypothetical protein BHQ16_11640 [Mycobacterium shimoidei]ORW78517.1 hypothetical protein AWC26_17655 [Mycobacterium shimoidei]SRX94760.1 hypothetical protein MSP7336_03021 [Mycobacterium shimoidei]
MTRSIVRTLAISAAAGTLLASAAACSCSVGTSHTVSKRQVADQITQRLTDANGNKPDSVTCPDDLDAKVGAQLNCTMKIKDRDYDVNVTVTSVEGSKVNFDMVETINKNQVASILKRNLTEQVGRAPDAVTCPDNLKGETGATLRCELTDGNEKFGILVTVTAIEAGDVHFNYKVDNQPH